jgi:glycosyltransferase involved in cell wall biosynthesis
MTQTNLPKLSVIVPVYNGEPTILECLVSLLEQDYPRDFYEVIVVNNRSTDKTAQIVKTFDVMYLMENETQSPSAARNLGAKVAHGDILVFFDADQIAQKNYLSKLIIGWEDSSYGAFGGKCMALDNISEKYLMESQQVSEELIERGLKINGSIYHMLGAGISAYRKDIFNQLGGFDPKMFSSEDFDLALRLQKQSGLKIKYNFDAYCFHYSRNAVGLLKREYRIGLGDEYFGDKYPELKKSKVVLLFKLTKRTFMGIFTILFNLIRLKSWSYKKTKVLKIWQDLVMKWANFLGRMHYRLGFKDYRIPADW